MLKQKMYSLLQITSRCVLAMEKAPNRNVNKKKEPSSLQKTSDLNSDKANLFKKRKSMVARSTMTRTKMMRKMKKMIFSTLEKQR
jgi:hypothetical protein